MIFTSRVAYVDMLVEMYRKPKEQGGCGLPGTIGVHANSHGGDAAARLADIERFMLVHSVFLFCASLC